MQHLAKRRCFTHGLREAVARCPECGRYFCRECITEHEDRVLCASCLKRSVKPLSIKSFRLGGFIRMIQVFLGFMILWLSFYCLGQALLSLPTPFHEGAVWLQGKWETNDGE